MAFLFLLLALTLPADARLRAGAAVADITPLEWPVRLIGNFGLTLSDAAHDPLHVRALVLQDGTTVAIAVIDSCYVKREEMDRAKQLASARTGIPASHILISATHTHSAPPSRAEPGNAKELAYVDRLVEQTAAAIAAAHRGLRPARIGFGVRMVPEELHNRRWFQRPETVGVNPFGESGDLVRMNPPPASPNLLHPAGGTDPGFSIVSVRGDDGRPLAILANYSLHYVGGTARDVSADYFGEYARQVAARVAPGDPAFVAMLSNGTSGDVNNIDFHHPRERSEPYVRIREVASKLAGHTVDAIAKMDYRPAAPVRAAQRELELRYRKPTAEQLRFARKALAEPDEHELPSRAKPYAERALALAAGPDTARVVLQAMRIGEFGIAALPFETFTETGLTVKELSAIRPVFTIELANGHYGYLPTPRHHELGGYETWLGTNNVEKEASVKITRVLLELLGEVAR